MHIIGTAGHVDHGKSALVRALTGTEPDRWLEEQRRGMTLDLGFARLAFDDGSEAGIVDVPGHERFLHNMLAGAAGMEIVLLVVAANEGVKPQTREHLAILRYLNVRRTLVVIGKADLLDAAGLEHAQRAIRASLSGTLAADAPFFPVSTLTGMGLDALRGAIAAALRALPERAPDAPPYLPIDRVFALAGHGTIVTGTLMQGRIRVGDTLALTPLGRSVRIRGLQVFGEKRDVAGGGTRVALNLPGIERTEIARGAVLAGRAYGTSDRIGVAFSPLPEARALLRRRTPVRAYIGAAEVLGTLVFDAPPADDAQVAAVLLLRRPVLVVPGTPFIVRRVSPMDVLGGGVLATAHDPAADGGDDRETAALLAALLAAGPAGTTAAAAGAAANIGETRAREFVADLLADGRAIAVAKPHGYVAGEIAQLILDGTIEQLERVHETRPWTLGLTSVAVARAVNVAESALVRILAAYVDAGRLAYRHGYYRTLDFTPRLNAAQRAFFDAAFADPAAGPNAPLPIDALTARMRASAVPELSAALETLIAGGALVRVGAFLYRGADLRRIRAQLEGALRARGQITVAEFRDASGTSRKYAVPLLEFFDATGVTVRTGDLRVLRRGAARESA